MGDSGNTMYYRISIHQMFLLHSPVFGVMSGFVGFNMTDYFQNWQKQLVFG